MVDVGRSESNGGVIVSWLEVAVGVVFVLSAIWFVLGNTHVAVAGIGTTVGYLGWRVKELENRVGVLRT